MPPQCNPYVCTNTLFSESPIAKVPVSGNGQVLFPDLGRPIKFRFPRREHHLLYTIRCPMFAPDIPLSAHSVKSSKHQSKLRVRQSTSEPEFRILSIYFPNIQSDEFSLAYTDIRLIPSILAPMHPTRDQPIRRK